METYPPAATLALVLPPAPAAAAATATTTTTTTTDIENPPSDDYAPVPPAQAAAQTAAEEKQSWLKRNKKCITRSIVGLLLGTVATVGANVLYIRSNNNINEGTFPLGSPTVSGSPSSSSRPSDSSSPSEDPSLPPSLPPSVSSGPSYRPSSWPSPSPSFTPSDSPSFRPSNQPSESTSPTQLLSMPPSSHPSTHPSESFSPSMSPSVGERPTSSFSLTETCYWIDVSVVFDLFSYETSWDVQRINDVGDNIVVKAYTGIDNDAYTLRKESMCLEEGQYEFTIYDSFGDGLLIDVGHYNVTSYGELIVEGAEFDNSEATSFSLPLPTASSAHPSESFSPSMSPMSSPSTHPSESFSPSMSPMSSPSTHPSESFSPTETCYWIDVSVVFDSFSYETSWDVQRINDTGDNIVVKAYNGTGNDANTLRKESMCLEEGQYEFTIYDSFGDGLVFLQGHYNVTSYGELIVEGAEFDNSEATSFSLPLPTAPSATP